MRSADIDFDKSSLVVVFRAVGRLNPDWEAEIGSRHTGGWIDGSVLQCPDSLHFSDLLDRIARRLRRENRRTVAIAFAVRLGWSADAAIAPYLLQQCVPDIRLSNISLKFSEDALLQKLSLREPRCVRMRSYGSFGRPSIDFLSTSAKTRSRMCEWIPG